MLIEYLILATVAFICNSVLGCIAATYIDSELDGRLHIWFKEAPSVVFQGLFLQTWPIWLIYYLLNK